MYVKSVVLLSGLFLKIVYPTIKLGKVLLINSLPGPFAGIYSRRSHDTSAFGYIARNTALGSDLDPVAYGYMAGKTYLTAHHTVGSDLGRAGNATL